MLDWDNEDISIRNLIQNCMPLFGAAYNINALSFDMQHDYFHKKIYGLTYMLHQIKSEQFYIYLGLY